MITTVALAAGISALGLYNTCALQLPDCGPAFEAAFEAAIPKVCLRPEDQQRIEKIKDFAFNGFMSIQRALLHSGQSSYAPAADEIQFVLGTSFPCSGGKS